MVEALEDHQAACCRQLDTLLEPALFRALGDPNRQTLMSRLAACGCSPTVGELATCCPVDLSVVSRHLTVLRQAGVVRAAKSGREVRYRLDDGFLVERLRALADAIEGCCRSQSGATPAAEEEP